MSWIRDITVRGVRQIERWDVTLPPVIGPPHVVLVGPCGSGKSSLLAHMQSEVVAAIEGSEHPSRAVEARGGGDTDLRMAYFGRPLRLGWTSEREVGEGFRDGRWIAVSLPALRRPLEVTGASSAGQPDPQLPDVRLAGRLPELLAQRQSALRLAERNRDARERERIEGWLEDVRDVIRRILGDEGLSFVIGQSEVAIDFSDGRRLPFEALSSGHSSAVTIWAELFLRAEAARRQTQDPTLDPKGVLLVDAVEAFLDPRLQRSLLPLIAERFPGVQIIASTSSPIVASSLERATVLDLAARKSRKAPSLPPPAALPPKGGAGPSADSERRRKKDTRPGAGPWSDD